MKADIAINVNCPKCGNVMYRYNTEKIVVCQNTRCDSYNKRYLIPSIELIEIKNTPYQELILKGQDIFNFHPNEPFSCPQEILEVARKNLSVGTSGMAYEIGASRYAEVLARYIEENK